MINTIVLQGHLTSDPKLIYDGETGKIVKMRMAHNTLKSTIFMDVKVFDKQADSCLQYLAKGREIFVEGRLELESLPVQLDKYSAVDSGFTAGDPYTSGVQKSFTVQPGNTLNSDTIYCWRVRAYGDTGNADVDEDYGLFSSNNGTEVKNPRYFRTGTGAGRRIIIT